MAKTRNEVERFAKLVLAGVERDWGKQWRRMISSDVQQALVSHEVMRIVLGWAEPERISAERVQEIARASYALIFPDLYKSERDEGETLAEHLVKGCS